MPNRQTVRFASPPCKLGLPVPLRRFLRRAASLAVQLGTAAALVGCGGGIGDEAHEAAQAQQVVAPLESTRKSALATAPATLNDSDALRYLASHPDLRAVFGLDLDRAKAHYLTRGRDIEGRKLSFEPERYIASYPDLMAAFGTNLDAAMRHYIVAGATEGRVASFDALRYIATYPDLIQAFGTDTAAAAIHYIVQGRSENRKPSFEAERYIASHTDLIATFGTDVDAALRDYITRGSRENRAITFDALRYIASYPDLVRAFGTNTAAASLHYISRGAAERRSISFDPLRYVASYGDLIAAFGRSIADAVVHFVTSGLNEGRTPSFNATQYLANYADLRAAFGTNTTAATQHFVNAGWTEGRTDKVVDTGVPTCLTTNVANTLGAADPFAVNAWHLKNTGPNQVVSAETNAGALAGTDLNVEAPHRGGVGCTGKGVLIAIVDSGLELAHEDIAPAVVAGKSFNFRNNSNNPSPAAAQTSVDHGTGVGGIAVARGWNGKGSRGTAPFASVVGYNAVTGGTGLAEEDGGAGENNTEFLSFGARALADSANTAVGLFGTRADDVAIFNYSAGTDYARPRLAATNPLDLSAQHRAMQHAATTLRAGKGAVIFQSGGNSFSELQAVVSNDPNAEAIAVNCMALRTAVNTGVFTNAAMLTCGSPDHEPENKPFAYSVASMHNTGKASSYSSAGASNWVAGTGGEFGSNEVAIITTDNSGCSSGANNVANKASFQDALDFFQRVIADLFGDSAVDPTCNYTGQMNGTSAAAPSVSGVAALLLEVNPNLSWRDVGYILAKTARKVDADIASGARAVSFRLNGAGAGVELDLPWLTNAAGFNFHNRYGFGMVDADAATKLAARYTTPTGRRTTDLTATGAVSAADTTADTANGARNYVTTARFAEAAAITGQLRIDVAVTNRGTLPVNPGLLQFELINKATGTRSILMPAFTSWQAGGQQDPIAQNGTRTYRLHSNAFYGENLAGQFEIRVRSFARPGAGQTHALSFQPTLTSFSL